MLVLDNAFGLEPACAIALVSDCLSEGLTESLTLSVVPGQLQGRADSAGLRPRKSFPRGKQRILHKLHLLPRGFRPFAGPQSSLETFVTSVPAGPELAPILQMAYCQPSGCLFPCRLQPARSGVKLKARVRYVMHVHTRRLRRASLLPPAASKSESEELSSAIKSEAEQEKPRRFAWAPWVQKRSAPLRGMHCSMRA